MTSAQHTSHKEKVAVVSCACKHAVQNDSEVGRDEQDRPETEHRHVRETSAGRANKGRQESQKLGSLQARRVTCPIYLREDMSISIWDRPSNMALTDKGRIGR